jgi:hypothetical protein
MMSQAGGEELETAISVSNTCAAPELGEGFPVCGVESAGPVWLFCNAQDGTNWAFNSSADFVEGAPIGSGLDEDGMLAPGGTFTVFLSEVIEAVVGEDAEEVSFVGYCWVVGQNFEAIAGTYVNFLPLVGIQQDFAMQSDFTGVPIMMEGGM